MQKNIKNYEKAYERIQNFIKANVNGFDGCVLGLSGGLDSVVVATLLAKSGINTHALLMPTKSSSKNHLIDAINLCKQLKLTHKIIEIDQIAQSFQDATNPSNLRLYNIFARIRMILLYDYSLKHNLLVVGTSNKSERMLGYGTIFGDLAYAFNPIGDIFKSDLYDFAKWLGVDEVFISKKPSADFYQGQSDENDLGYTYQKLDKCLKGGVCDEKLRNFVNKKVAQNTFKRKSPKILYLDDLI